MNYINLVLIRLNANTLQFENTEFHGHIMKSDLIKELEKVCANKTKIDADKTSSKLKEATNYILKMDKTNEKLLVNIEKLKKEITDLKKSK